MVDLNFEVLFAKSPNNYMVLDRALRYVAANEAYLRTTATTWEAIRGRSIFDAFPNDPDDPANEPARLLRASFERVLATGKPDTLALIPYRVADPDDPTGPLVDRFWSATHTPILDDAGAVAFILQHTVDVTELERLRAEATDSAPTPSPRSVQIGADVLRRAGSVQEENRVLDGERRHLRGLFEQAPVFIAFLRGSEHVFDIANAAYRQLVGHRDVLGKPIREALPEVAGQGYFELLDKVFQTGEGFVGTGLRVTLQRAPGASPEARYVDFTYQAVRDGSGRITGIFVAGIDLTESRLATLERERLATIVERWSDTVAIAAPDGALQYLNEAGQRSLGIRPDEVASLRGEQFFVADDLPKMAQEIYPAVLRDGRWEGHFRFRHHVTGAPIAIHYNVFALRDRTSGELQGFASVSRDIRDDLARDAERTRFITALEASNKALDQFAYVASHDLKTPLRGIGNLAQWIEDDTDSTLSDESRENLRLLRGRVVRMDALIDGVLSYSRSGRTLDAYRPIVMEKMLRDVVELLAPPPSAMVEIGPGMPTLEAPLVPLQQVFLNLIGNALKHARRTDARVTVSVTDEGDRWRFAVTDNGPGIPLRFHERVWGLFQTLESRDKVEGTGIGLAVVKKIVEAYGGAVGIDSDVGRGATFFFTWPKGDYAGRSKR